MRILVTGAGGLLGSQLVQELRRNHAVTGLYRNVEQLTDQSGINQVTGDLTNREFVKSLIGDPRHELIINCAGAADVDRCETDHSYALDGNVATTENLAQAAAKHQLRVIHISSDYVFGGSDGPWNEDDQPDPINFYGKTKLLGEAAILDSGINSTVVRVCALYSTDLSRRKNLYRSVATPLLQGKEYLAAGDLYSNPTEVTDLARALSQLAVLKELPRLIHLAGSENISRYDFACAIAVHIGADVSLIKKCSLDELGLPAKRPTTAGLISRVSWSLLRYDLRGFSTVLAETN